MVGNEKLIKERKGKRRGGMGRGKEGEGEGDRKIDRHCASPFSMPRLRWSRVVALFSALITAGVLYSRIQWQTTVEYGEEVQEEIDDVSFTVFSF